MRFGRSRLMNFRREERLRPVVLRRLLRSDAGITLRSYAHAIGDAQHRAIDSFADRVLGS